MTMNYIAILKAAQCLLSSDSRYDPMTRHDSFGHDRVRAIIKDQFGAFGKGNEKYIELLREIDQIDATRCTHIVFTFLFGVFIYYKSNTIQNAIDKKVGKMLNASGHKDDFAFLWFLICLFHDLGYAKEDKNENSKIEQCWVCCKKLGSPSGVPKFYKDCYQSYFHYRKTEHRVIDHGIYAGLKMYEDLCKIREEMKDANLGTNFWREELVPLYNLASWVVLAHNVWFSKDTETEKCATYEKYQLNQLVLATEHGTIKDYRISLKKYPVLFLFCLVDLIEPLKRIEKIECCVEINISVNKDAIAVCSELECACIKKYLKDIAGAKDWLTNVSRARNGKGVKIHLA